MHFADFSDSSSDDGIFLSASSPKPPVANMAIKSVAAPSKAPSLGPPMTSVRRNDPSNATFKFGQFKGKTFWEILHDHPDYFAWTQKNAKSPGASEYAEWVNQHFEYRGAVVYRRNELEPPSPLPKQHTRLRKPPNPPKEKCAVCTQFTRQGSTGYTIKETCLPCGHATTTRREMIPQYTFEECPHEDKDFRGSSRSVHRTFCKQCCTFLDETPRELQKTRKAVSHKVLDAPLERVSIIQQVDDDSKEMTFSPEMLDMVLTEFASLVASYSESEAITSTKLHEPLHQSIANAEGENSFSVVGEEENYGEDFAGIGVCFHGYEPEVEMSDGLVHVFQETRDMYDMNDPNIDVVLDEGCNSTCHSKHWETKLKNLGCQFPFKDTKGKTFCGLWTGRTSTEGSRTLPFSMSFMDSHCTPVHGALETHQLSTGKSPLLLPLHAQAHLGLVKDLKKGTVSIDDNQLPVFRCSRTGLMMLAITPHQLDPMGKAFHNQSQNAIGSLELHSQLSQT